MTTPEKKESFPLPVLLGELEETASKAGVTLRYERLVQGPVRSASGSCLVRGEHLIIIDSRLGTLERVEALSEELARFDFEEIFVPPAVRRILEKKRRKRGASHEEKGREDWRRLLGQG